MNIGKPANLNDINNPDWIPSLHMGYERNDNIEQKINRFERVKRRKVTKRDFLMTGYLCQKIIFILLYYLKRIYFKLTTLFVRYIDYFTITA